MAVDLYTSPTLIITFLVLILTWIVIIWRKNNKNLPPGPWGLPFLGYYPFISETHESFLKLGKIYGNVCCFRTIGGRRLIVLNGAKTIKDVLVNRGDEFTGRPQESNLVSWISRGYGVAQEEGEPWKIHRRFFKQSAKEFGFGKLELESHIHDEIRQMISEFRKKSGKDYNTYFDVAYATNSVISRIIFSKKQEKEGLFKEFLKMSSTAVDFFVAKRFLLLGYVYDLFIALAPKMGEFTKSRDFMLQFTEECIEERLKIGDLTNPMNYVDAYLQNRNQMLKKNNEGTFTRDRLQGIAMNMIFEGTESIAFTTTSMMHELSKHIQVQKVAQKELDAVVGKERFVSWSDRQNLPYLDATVQELYRTAAKFLVSTMYSNYEETTIEGYRIPKRSLIVANYYSIHVDPELYPVPKKFNPLRFLNSEGKRIKTEGPYPFGVGKRNCIGETLAQMEVFLIIGSILQHFTLHPGTTKETLKLEARF